MGLVDLSLHFSQDAEIIAQGFVFTGGFLEEWDNSLYCRIQKIKCRFKEQAKFRHSVRNAG